MNGHDDPGFSLLFEPDALREEERRQWYGLDDPQLPANEDDEPCRYEQCLVPTPHGVCRLVKGHSIDPHEGG